MTTALSIKRYSSEEAQAIMAKLREYTFEDLHPLFKEGREPHFEEIEGDTAGSFLAWNPETAWSLRLLTRIGFDNPLARWTGKRFLSSFDRDNKGKGLNLYQNLLLPRRFSFNTCVRKSMFDQNQCLALVYSPFPSPMAGTIDELRKIEEGVFLGQGYHKSPWEKEYSLLTYFVLCAFEG